MRSNTDPNYSEAARLLSGAIDEVIRMQETADSLNEFQSKDTAHQVSPAAIGTNLIMSVVSSFDRPDGHFSTEDQISFHGCQA